MQTISIIRERGQLTIPDSIRRNVSWAKPLSAVSISILKPNEIVIRPHVQSVDWDQIWKNIRASRAISGKGSTSAAEFLAEDRNSR